MVTFVLIHGSFHGGWCWQRVSARLRETGHTVYTPTLTGLGERSHLVSPQVDLELHIDDVSRFLESYDLEEVVIVGHSYGGMVVTGVAERQFDRLSHLVILDGFRPEHGQSAWDISPDAQSRWEAAAKDAGTPWLVPPPDPETAYGLDKYDAAWTRERLTPTPIGTHEEPLDTPNNRAADLPQTYITCTQYDGFEAEAERARAGPVDYFELNTGHDAMLTAPDELAEILIKATGRKD